VGVSETLAAVHAEITKLRGVRGTSATLAAFVVISILIAALDGWSARNAIDSHSSMLRPDFSSQQAGFDGLLYGQLALIAFGAFAFSAEYASGMMRVSLLAVPRRGRLFAAKMLAAGAIAAVVATPVAVVCYLATQAALGSHGVSIGAPGVPRALAGAVVYLTSMTLLSAGMAAVSRNTMVPLAILLPLVLGAGRLLEMLGLTKKVAQYLPDQAGARLFTVNSGGVLVGFAAMLAWVVAAAIAGRIRHGRWDA
jgi:ABC-2 type transport system permease protein